MRETGLSLVAATQSRVLISTLLRSSVFRGSDSPPDCHSLPLPFKSRRLYSQNKRRHTKVPSFIWCEKRDLNPYGVTTRPSNVRVCQFRHSRIRRLRNIGIILYFFQYVNSFLKKTFYIFSKFQYFTAPLRKRLKCFKKIIFR